ncbi:MAG: bifunctional tRNA (5-methylaminomethyl-2-thiouridine)(34)-methyltransferase MnmD/FAD-dependent 5-carboxymethylaminomethyl-2-thiouridine(34) oxidoreductase MnmC [Rhodospirillaceae bacterium]
MISSRKFIHLKNADLDVGPNGAPRSKQFQDTYFDADDGLAESRYVFLDGCGLRDTWRERHRFTLAETGFGTGLNFLAAWHAWQQDPQRPDILHYISVERFPLLREDLVSSHKHWPELCSLSSDLTNSYPTPQPGYHRLFFEDGKIALTLLFGDVLEMLGGLEADVDAWFLDGFAPDRNPDMWQPEVLSQIARLSHLGTRLATFTVAGPVRRGLSDVGFSVSKRKGFGKKREMLQAEFSGPLLESRQEPWFKTPAVHTRPSTDIAVIGSGLAGASAAHAFQRNGCNVTVIEQQARIASGASATPAAIFMPRLTAAASVDGAFYATAWPKLIRLIATLEDNGFDLQHMACGVLQLAENANDKQRHLAIANSGVLPNSYVRTVDANEASGLSGVSLKRGGLFFPHGGTISSQRLCEALLHQTTLISDTRAAGLRRDGDGWQILGNRGNAILKAELVVLACGLETQRFTQAGRLQLIARRGQVTRVRPTTDSAALSCVITGQGYVTPTIDGQHIIGATFDHFDDTLGISDSLKPETAADRQNLQEAQALMAGNVDWSAVLESWVGIRCTTADHLPLAGALPDLEAYAYDFAAVRHGHRWTAYPAAQYHKGLYVLTGLGARGTVAAPLAAEVLMSLATGGPSPVSRDIVHALHPARFTIRDLKRAKS